MKAYQILLIISSSSLCSYALNVNRFFQAFSDRSLNTTGFPFGQQDIFAFPTVGSLDNSYTCTFDDKCSGIYKVKLQTAVFEYIESDDDEIFKWLQALFGGEKEVHPYLPPMQDEIQLDHIRYFLSEQLPEESISIDLSANNDGDFQARLLNVTQIGDTKLTNYTQNLITARTNSYGFVEVEAIIEVSNYSPGSKLFFTSNFDNLTSSSTIYLVEPKGLCGVFDIDETLRLFGSSTEAIKTILYREYLPVPGMPEVMNNWYKQATPNSTDSFGQPLFFYLSAGPWQFIPSSLKFLNDSNYPGGPIAVNRFTTQPDSIKQFFQSISKADAYGSKTENFAHLFSQLPNRTYFMVGDTAMKDPQFIADSMRNSTYQNRTAFGIIRKTPEANPISKNYDSTLNKTFKGVPEDRWMSFIDAKELDVVDTGDIVREFN